MNCSREGLCRIWLAFSESATVKAKRRLVEYHGAAEAAFDRFSDASREHIGKTAWEELAELKERGLEQLAASLEDSGVKVIFPEDPGYPVLLNQIVDPPDLLFFKGSMDSPQERAIAVIGSRRETRYGREQAYRIAKDLAHGGVTVVSGLARGVDTAAHLGALDGKGRTIAVLGSGLGRIYPQENEALAQRIIHSGGAIISELPTFSEPLAYHFPVRNRIVSGLSNGILLVEAREKSGTLITVGHALDQGREVFALPGQVDSAGSLIPHRFIREGARLCTCADDILEDMGWKTSRENAALVPDHLPPIGLTSEQTRIYHALRDEAKSFAELLSCTSLPVKDLGVQITMLEMGDVIEPLPGRMYRLKRC